MRDRLAELCFDVWARNTTVDDAVEEIMSLIPDAPSVATPDARRVAVAFVAEAISDHCAHKWWQDADLQEKLEKHGLLTPFTVTASCGEWCECSEGDICYRVSDIGNAVRALATPDARRVDDGPTMASLFGACPNATKGDGDDDARRVVEAAIAFAGALEQAREVVSDEDGMYTSLDKTQAKSEVNYREDLLLAAVRALAALNAGASHG